MTETPSAPVEERTPVLCFSHLRWNFVYQRPQHLLSRVQQLTPVFFFEEPLPLDEPDPRLEIAEQPGGVTVLTPMLPRTLSGEWAVAAQRTLLDEWLAEQGIEDFVAWYYTPMALLFTDHLQPVVTVYDCMDELSAFQSAPPELIGQEQRLFRRAGVVFAGGRSLWESKKQQHGNAHLFPSSIDRAHFAQARAPQADPEDQAAIPHPRIGFFGVLDERLDRDLLREVAAARPDWHFVMIGPVVKISTADLPQSANIHYLGQKSYTELPRYIAGWDVAMLPFAQNSSTRFISPTKTPEYLAAGKPVVSTPVRDVVEPYGRLGLAHIAGDSRAFEQELGAALAGERPGWLDEVDSFLETTSWDKTFQEMWNEVRRLVAETDAESSTHTEGEAHV
jgi:glycosyltransferase involved in cell wall biosynthesis